MGESKSLENKIEIEKKKFRESSNGIYDELLRLHVTETDAREWYFKPNIYLNNKTPYDFCKSKKYDLVVFAAKTEIEISEWASRS